VHWQQFSLMWFYNVNAGRVPDHTGLTIATLPCTSSIINERLEFPLRFPTHITSVLSTSQRALIGWTSQHLAAVRLNAKTDGQITRLCRSSGQLRGHFISGCYETSDAYSTVGLVVSKLAAIASRV